MNEADALRVVLTRAFDSRAGEERLLDDAQWRAATQAALDGTPRDAPAEDFVVLRARHAAAQLARVEPALEAILDGQRAPAAWLGAAALAGVLGGAATDLFTGSREFNLFAPAAWIVIFWNLAVYAMLAWNARPRRQHTGARHAGSIGRATDWLIRHRLRLTRRLVRRSAARLVALGDFAADWITASKSLRLSRATMLLHVAGSMFAATIILGMYLRGLVADYRVDWGSTFLDAESTHALLSLLLWPAIQLSGIAIPDAARLELLREGAQAAWSEATAAPWIHLYAIMIALFVVLPRALLAAWSGLQARRLANEFPLCLEEPYYEALRGIHAAGPAVHLAASLRVAHCQVLPCALPLTPRAERGLRDVITRALGRGATVSVAPCIALGGEEDPEALPASPAETTHTVIVFELAATPEAEVHGTLVARTRSGAGNPVIVVVNEASYTRRFDAARCALRRQAWLRFADRLGIPLLLVDLEDPRVSEAATQFRAIAHGEPVGGA